MEAKIMLDSCVIISDMDGRGTIARLRNALRGKRVGIVICDTVLQEVHHIRKIEPEKVVSRLSRMLGRKVEVLCAGREDRTLARSVTDQYHFCHHGDNIILALCRTRSYILITFDRMLLQACNIVGVMAFHPTRAGGI